MTKWPEEALILAFHDAGNHVGDDEYDVASYQIGFSILAGSTLQEAMNLWGYASQEPDLGNWTLRLWPSFEEPTGGNIIRPQALQETP